MMRVKRLLEGKISLITGSSKGIGKAIAERFAQEGAIVYANSRKQGSIDQWAHECSVENETQVIPVYFDIRDSYSAKEAIMQIKKEQQRLDVLVNNAGVVSYEPLGMIDFEKFREMWEVNVVSVIQLIQLVSRLMARQTSGSIINISSIVGTNGVKGQLAYSATKGAVISLTKSAAKELANLNIRVNAIAPGMIDTERLRDVMEKKFINRISDIGMGRLGKPEEVADVCVFLASELSSYVTGQIIGVDGSSII
jgi:3-oxoacyl-[acyl-carrier protein] reductase